MKITITGKKFRVTESISERITEKLLKFDKYFDKEATANVMLRSRKNDELIEITIFYEGTMFRAETEDDSILNALDKALDIIERQIRKNKTKLEKRLKKGSFDKAAFIDQSDWVEIPEEKYVISRVKEFVLKPMTPDEAILQMNLIGHEFFMFANSDNNGQICVVYRRKDDEYGLIEAVEE